MTQTVEEIKQRLESFRTNPNAIQRYALDLLEDISEGSYIVSDPSNPFIFLLEVSAITASSSMDESRSRVRELYPQLASKPEDIYRHMSDVDYINQFSIPGKIIMSLILSVNDIITLALPVEGQSYKKLTIPKDSTFSISDLNFGIHYPIDLIVSLNNELRIVLDTTFISPIQSITDDIIDFRYFTYSGEKYVNMDISMEQFTLTSHLTPLNVNTGFNHTFNFTDLYFFCRVYSKNVDNSWSELLTTHSREVFDYAEPTAQLIVLENQITVIIPQIYITRNVTNHEIRVDIYTTKGNINTNLGNFTQDNSQYLWRDLDANNRNVYSAPLGRLTSISMYSDSIITGGREGENFLEIRNRIINSRARRDVPIRNSELEVYLADRGYDLIRSIDNITSRVYLATKNLPTITDTNLIIQGTVYNISIYEGDLNRQGINKHASSYTILPNVLFIQRGGTINLTTEAEENYILNLNPDELINYLNNVNVYYNPYHYVIIYLDGYLTHTPYFLTEPLLLSRQKLLEDTTNGYQMSSDKINIEYSPDGYMLKISTTSNQAIKDLNKEFVKCQISFIPDGDINRVFKNGEFIGESDGEKVFTFDLKTEFDINRNKAIALKGFSRTIDDDFDYRINLNAKFWITFIIDLEEGGSEVAGGFLNDVHLGLHLLSKNTSVISVESLEIHLGEPLELLLSSSRMSVSGYEYEVYKADVPAVYTENVYERDENGFMVIKTDPITGDRFPVILHQTGDPIIDEDGNPVIAHEKGSIRLVNGEPVILRERGRLFSLDILLLNSMYLFITLPEQKQIVDTIPKMINNLFKNELNIINDILLERTELFYLPKKTMGKINIQVNRNSIIEIESEQSIIVNFYVTELTNRDERLKERYQLVTNDEIVKWLNQTTLSISSLISTLTEILGDGILGIKIEWTDELEEYDTFVIIDSSDSISIKQVLSLNYDNTLEVRNNINYVYTEQGI